MGVILQSSSNLLNTLLKNYNDLGAVIFTSKDLNNRFQDLVDSTVYDQLQGSMDRLHEQDNKDCVRNTMMRQEKTFKEQVHELHRLYQVQRMLMDELRTEEAQKAVTDSTSETSNSLYRSSTMAEEPSEEHRGFDLETPAEESEVELSLSIGGSSSKKKNKPKPKPKPKQRLHREPKNEETKKLVLSNECSERRESLQRPPWLFQPLSLNKT